MSTEFRDCLKCPIRIKPTTSTRRRQHGGKPPTKDAISERRQSLRLRNRVLEGNVYCELNDDEDFDSDDGLGQDFQQGYLCASADTRRVGGPGGEATIIHLKELRTLLRTQQTLDDQTVWLTPQSRLVFQLRQTHKKFKQTETSFWVTRWHAFCIQPSRPSSKRDGKRSIPRNGPPLTRKF